MKPVKLLKLRPSVAAFAQLMERRLRENDHKGGWDNASLPWILGRVIDELDELLSSFRHGGDPWMRETMRIIKQRLQGALLQRPRNADAAVIEAVDTANFLMMVADLCGGLKTRRK